MNYNNNRNTGEEFNIIPQYNNINYGENINIMTNKDYKYNYGLTIQQNIAFIVQRSNLTSSFIGSEYPEGPGYTIIEPSFTITHTGYIKELYILNGIYGVVMKLEDGIITIESCHVLPNNSKGDKDIMPVLGNRITLFTSKKNNLTVLEFNRDMCNTLGMIETHIVLHVCGEVNMKLFMQYPFIDNPHLKSGLQYSNQNKIIRDHVIDIEQAITHMPDPLPIPTNRLLGTKEDLWYDNFDKFNVLARMCLSIGKNTSIFKDVSLKDATNVYKPQHGIFIKSPNSSEYKILFTINEIKIETHPSSDTNHFCKTYNLRDNNVRSEIYDDLVNLLINNVEKTEQGIKLKKLPKKSTRMTGWGLLEIVCQNANKSIDVFDYTVKLNNNNKMCDTKTVILASHTDKEYMVNWDDNVLTITRYETPPLDYNITKEEINPFPITYRKTFHISSNTDYINIYNELHKILMDSYKLDLHWKSKEYPNTFFDINLHTSGVDVIKYLISQASNEDKKILERIHKCCDITIENEMVHSKYYKLGNSLIAIRLNEPYICVIEYVFYGEGGYGIGRTDTLLGTNDKIKDLITYFIKKLVQEDRVVPAREYKGRSMDILNRILKKSTIDITELKKIIVLNYDIVYNKDKLVFTGRCENYIYQLFIHNDNIVISTTHHQFSFYDSTIFSGDINNIDDVNKCCTLLEELMSRFYYKYNEKLPILDNISKYSGYPIKPHYTVEERITDYNSYKGPDHLVGYQRIMSGEIPRELLIKCENKLTDIYSVHNGDDLTLVSIASFYNGIQTDALNIGNKVNYRLTEIEYLNHSKCKKPKDYVYTPHTLMKDSKVFKYINTYDKTIISDNISYIDKHLLRRKPITLYKNIDNQVLVILEKTTLYVCTLSTENKDNIDVVTKVAIETDSIIEDGNGGVTKYGDSEVTRFDKDDLNKTGHNYIEECAKLVSTLLKIKL